jgi:hypothetical protein
MEYVTDIDATLHFERAATADDADDTDETVASFLSRDTASVQRCSTGTGATVRHDANCRRASVRTRVFEIFGDLKQSE